MASKYCFALDLKNDNKLIEEYKKYHESGAVWPEIVESIRSVGITGMEIFLVGNRLFMIMNVDETFSFENKTRVDQQSEKVQEWEALMSTFQQKLPWANEGQSWELMDKIFDLNEQ
ncbi:L-rhamnose mutarotase [Psychrosphaera sp. B3R10]|uniref:L-rhamnose mutarotase n=1 Tax=unclassified Psychrosphaera TaxID=2641570 RepID=UPI001C0A2786|nr:MULTISPECIES: L-rhamnose mutarotase [unclassified Psychrosphaera]MBU2882464.1 L-rhamnose mutarotase [Psychrosphaera sp. I2R16]MBU2990285.1 L-rhamnose mutarotase [Psychrosphaera sp. B3R10]